VQTVDSLGELNRAILDARSDRRNGDGTRTRLDREYAVWLLARAISPGRCGIVGLGELRAAVLMYHVCRDRSLTRYVRRGEGLFWRKLPGDRLLLTGAHNLAERLGADPPRRVVELPVGKLGSVRGFRAMLTESLIAANGHKTRGGADAPKQMTQSQTRLANELGRSRGAIGGYLKHLQGQAKERQAIRHDGPIPDKAERERQGLYLSQLEPGGPFVLMKRWASKYTSQLTGHRWGQRRARSSYSEAAQRVYYRDATTAARALQHGAEFVIWPDRDQFNRPRRDVLGYTVLLSCEQVNGHVYASAAQ